MSARVHFIGIGGIGMSALAQILLARGDTVSGSDAEASSITRRLEGLGARIAIGHAANNVEGADRVIVSDAIREDNAELARARALGLPIQRRSVLLAELMRAQRGIAVSGTHGKTTATAMIAAILIEAGLDPMVVLGGEYAPFGGNARVGCGDWLVAEACEAYDSFLDLAPEIALLTNIEPDHLDHHGTLVHLKQSFVQFLSQVRIGGAVVMCADRPELRELKSPGDRRVVWYGFDEAAEVRGGSSQWTGGMMRCPVTVEGAPAGTLTLPIPGVHNLLNALGAMAVSLAAGAPVAVCLAALANFQGVGRRFEVVGEAAGVTVVDDYAHHPTEIAATIAAARAAYPGRRLVAIFQPHLYSRTRDFAAGFANALAAADLVALAEIYPAREAAIPGVSSELIAHPLRAVRGEDGVVTVAKDELVTALPPLLRINDVVLVMGAGDIGQRAHELAEAFTRGTARPGI